MNTLFFLILTTVSFASVASAQERIYRCGNEYTNTVSDAQAKHCKLVSGGNVTVVQSQKPPASAGNKASTGSQTSQPTQAGQAGQRIDPGEQRAKDSDARQILESELKKAEARQAELLAQYNNGEPDKIGGEARNHQKYLDRVAELQASIRRNESDIAGIRRELGRVAPAASSASASK
jgi:hypothetical protein